VLQVTEDEDLAIVGRQAIDGVGREDDPLRAGPIGS
jgi:hypothetical protein